MSDYETIMSDYETKYDKNMRHMTVICERRQVKMSGLSHKYVNIYKMVKRIKRRVTKRKTTRKTNGRRKLQNIKSNDIANAAMALGAIATGKVAKSYFGTQYSAYDKPYGNKTATNSMTLVTNDKSSERTGGYAQWTQRYQKGTFGKLTPRKIDKLSIDKIIFTHQRLGAFNDYGQLFLGNEVEANGVLRLPLVLMELNSCNNNINGTISTTNPVYQLSQNGTTTQWLSQSGQLPDGSFGSFQWQLERAPHTATQTNAYPGEAAIHLWSSVDLECWGTRNKPTKYDIMLCQFSEDVLPNYGTSDANATEFWQSMIKHYTYSPLAKMSNGFNAKKMKIMKHYTFNLDPTASYENDPDPHVKTMKLFYRFNRKCNFQWKYSNAAGQTISNLNDGDWQQEDAENQTQVHPNARIYVMIRASNFTRIAFPTTSDNSTCPSISWRIRSAFMVNQ